MRRRHPRLGLGPVFAYEWVASSRRWQAYALRSLFLLIVLLALMVIWNNNPLYAYRIPLAELAHLSQQYFLALAGTQLAVVLLAAPAATAGAICLDRTRGTLAHMLLTDLSDAEIVLGKLAARLVPVLTLIACTLPVMELLTLIGGLEPVAVLGTFVVTVGVAVLGCSLAMVFSLWLGKTHVALLATYGVCCLWLVVAPIADLLGPSPSPLRKTNPFYLALAPYLWSDSARWTDYLWFLGTTCSISALLIALAVLQLRPVCTRERGKRQTSAKAAPTGIYGRVLARSLPWLTPSLDRNPVLWHEWHRGRLSRIGLVVTVLCVTLASLSSVLAILSDSKVAAAVASGLLVAICLLYLSVTSATSLAEERARGSLDILLTTPLSARQIVLGKWLGTFRIVPLLAILPWLVIAVISYIHDER
jgi:ABC-type transport system involved in multi-copper enzyme maturation permease subunit